MVKKLAQCTEADVGTFVAATDRLYLMCFYSHLLSASFLVDRTPGGDKRLSFRVEFDRHAPLVVKTDLKKMLKKNAFSCYPDDNGNAISYLSWHVTLSEFPELATWNNHRYQAAVASGFIVSMILFLGGYVGWHSNPYTTLTDYCINNICYSMLTVKGFTAGKIDPSSVKVKKVYDGIDKTYKSESV